MADSENDLAADTGAGAEDSGAGVAADTGAGAEDSGAGAADDFPTVEPAPEPDNPRYGTEHEEPEGDPQPLPGTEG
ncbi:hypothetical protein BH23ACT12_BH23ACT12_06290 [soil metagenome]